MADIYREPYIFHMTQKGQKLTYWQKFNLRHYHAISGMEVLKNRSHASMDTGDMTIRD